MRDQPLPAALTMSISPKDPFVPPTEPQPVVVVAGDGPADQRAISIERERLPLSCPTPETALWNLHPRVYLPIEATGRAFCPYCGTQYQLIV